MKFSVLTIGNELLCGRVQDANSVAVARELLTHRWRAGSFLSVGDDFADIKKALCFLLQDADVVIISGGLGPTADDITTEAIAKALNRKTFTDESALAHVKEIFSKHKLQWTDNSAKQAVFPEGATPIANSVGTAWGYSLPVSDFGGDKLVVVIPGPPREAKTMLTTGAIPLFKKLYSGDSLFRTTTVAKLFDIPEASADKILAGSGIYELGVNVGFYPHFPELLVVVTAYEESEAKAQALAEAAKAILCKELGEHIFSSSMETLEEIVAQKLIEKHLSITVAESCSGGLIADRLTDVSGSSAYFHSGIVCYSNDAKSKLLNVPSNIIEMHGAVSEQTALLMAQGARSVAGTGIGLATTGIAGPTGGSVDKPVGTVYVALADNAGSVCKKFSFRWDRRRNKIITSQMALIMLLRHIGKNS